MLQNRMDRYRANAFLNVFGWVGGQAVDALQVAASFHRQHNICGDALEIGVFQGRFFLALMAALEENEIAVAMDIFDDQELNYDLSGDQAGLESIFRANVEQYADNPQSMKLFQADSLTVDVDVIKNLSINNGFRIISIDGGHTVDHAMNDLIISSKIIKGGGVILLDDFLNSHWPGVQEGYQKYMTFSNCNLAPVLYADNKLMMTTISHHPRMLKYVREHFNPAPNRVLAEVSSRGFAYLALN